MAEKANMKADSDKVTEKSWKQIVASSKYGYKEFSRQLAHIQGIEWDEKYYQHVYQVLDNGVNFRDGEERAFEVWHECLKNPFAYADMGYNKPAWKRNIDYIESCIMTRIYNPAQLRRDIAKIKKGLQ